MIYMLYCYVVYVILSYCYIVVLSHICYIVILLFCYVIPYMLYCYGSLRGRHVGRLLVLPESHDNHRSDSNNDGRNRVSSLGYSSSNSSSSSSSNDNNNNSSNNSNKRNNSISNEPDSARNRDFRCSTLASPYPSGVRFRQTANRDYK